MFSMSSKFVTNCFLLVSSFVHIYSAIRGPVGVYLTMEFELGIRFTSSVLYFVGFSVMKTPSWSPLGDFLLVYTLFLVL